MRLARASHLLSRCCLTKVLVRLPAGTTVELTGAAADVWRLLEPPRTVAEIAAALADRYGTTPAALQDELDGLLAELLTLGVVKAPADAPGTPSHR